MEYQKKKIPWYVPVWNFPFTLVLFLPTIPHPTYPLITMPQVITVRDGSISTLHIILGGLKELKTAYDKGNAEESTPHAQRSFVGVHDGSRIAVWQ